MPSYTSPRAKEQAKIRKAEQSLAAYHRAIKRDPLRNRRAQLRQRYGLELSDFDALFVAQDSRCAACGATASGGRGWNVHHSHETNRVLAILCNNCNRGSGLCADSPAVLRRLAAINEEVTLCR